MTWRSLHLYLADPASTDAFLLEVIGPTLAAYCSSGQAGSWFYMRYWEGGPHIRLRVKDMPDDAFALLMTALRERFLHYHGDDRGLARAYPDEMVFERPGVDAEARRWLPQGTVSEIAYEPEMLRYGGPHAMASSERLFSLSTELALQVIGAAAAGTARQSSGLLLTSVALAAATRDHDGLLAFLYRMKQTWQKIAGDARHLEAQAERVALAQRRRYLDLIRLLQAGGAAPHGQAGTWWHMLQQAVREWRQLAARGALMCPVTQQWVTEPGLERAIAALVDSHIHMMNNRLGLAPAVEYWYAHMLAHAAHGCAGKRQQGRKSCAK